MTAAEPDLSAALARIADALERLSPPPATPSLEGADAFVWSPRAVRLEPVPNVSAIPLAMLSGIDLQADILLANTDRFARGLPANNAMLWGARGTGKSSLVKAVHRHVLEAGRKLALVEIQRDDLSTLPVLLDHLRAQDRRTVLFCDDLSFEREDADYKALKSVLDGGIRGRPDNVLFYATSNRRHLMPRDMMDNESGTAINPGEAVEEKVSLSDRFGLWLGFHAINQDTYLAMVERYAASRALAIDPDSLRAQALAWSMTRGARSGRVAFQFIEDLTGRLAG
ncbi:ATP-binding protein [Acetobacteraceae bacterium KSS8]|uniref:ATP-binding protein n=1 Tax=Endosaccharibacter trunci TaxID=2812733 RepID=A0ABT1W513_9PROT|nr:ATP-binding protein [Acetobacteraceae bacterium KSS8]